jgi:hypothetical protein
MSSREIFIETKRIGNAMQVIAMDAETQIEVSFQAPIKASKLQVQRLAAAKLNYVLNKNKE